MHLESWKTMTKPNSDGGLGIYRVKTKNVIVNVGLPWKFVSGPDSY